MRRSHGSCESEATSSKDERGALSVASAIGDPAACAGPARGEGLLGRLDERVSRVVRKYQGLDNCVLIGGGSEDADLPSALGGSYTTA